MQRYRQTLKVLHQLSDLLVSLREVGQHIQKKKVIAAVAPQRRELVCDPSAIRKTSVFGSLITVLMTGFLHLHQFVCGRTGFSSSPTPSTISTIFTHGIYCAGAGS